MLVLKWKERAFIEIVNSRFFVDFRRPYWCTKTVHQYGVSIQSSTKVRETFRQITQKLWATKTWDLKKFVWILVFYNISFSWLLPLDGFQFIFLLRDSENDPRETIYKLTWSEQNVCSVSLLDVVSKRLVLKNNFVSKRPASFRGVIFITVHIWSLADDSMAPLGL